MPELPEVEIIKRGLEKKVVGLTIKKLEVLNKKSVLFDPQKVEGKKVVEVWRRAKMLGINLGHDLTLLLHLKMTGQLIVDDGKNRVIGGHPTPDMRDQMPNKSTVAIFEFSDPLRPRLSSTQARSEASGSKLYFNDQRRFGWIKLVNSSELMVHGEKILGKLGPEPFSKEFTWTLLKENLLKHPKMPLKVVLMDQSTISGIGNIYASESLFLARIDPRRKVNSLSDKEFQKLHGAIKKALQVSIDHGGSTRAHFVNIDGEKGYFLDFANVYGKQGQPCKGCKGKVVKITQAGRGTYYCPKCQR